MPKRIRKSAVTLDLGPLYNTEPGSEGSAPKPTPPKEPAKAPEEPETKGEIESKIEAQQKVNRDLEAKLNTLKDGLKAALGIEDKKADPTELVGKLQEQLDNLTHTNLVNDVARRHGITDDTDVDLLRKITDKGAMEALAARLAPADASKPGKPGTPKADPSQARGSGGNEAPSSVASGRDLYAQLHKKTQ